MTTPAMKLECKVQGSTVVFTGFQNQDDAEKFAEQIQDCIDLIEKHRSTDKRTEVACKCAVLSTNLTEIIGPCLELGEEILSKRQSFINTEVPIECSDYGVVQSPILLNYSQENACPLELPCSQQALQCISDSSDIRCYNLCSSDSESNDSSFDDSFDNKDNFDESFIEDSVIDGNINGGSHHFDILTANNNDKDLELQLHVDTTGVPRDVTCARDVKWADLWKHLKRHSWMYVKGTDQFTSYHYIRPGGIVYDDVCSIVRHVCSTVEYRRSHALLELPTPSCDYCQCSGCEEFAMIKKAHPELESKMTAELVQCPNGEERRDGRFVPLNITELFPGRDLWHYWLKLHNCGWRIVKSRGRKMHKFLRAGSCHIVDESVNGVDMFADEEAVMSYLDKSLDMRTRVVSPQCSSRAADNHNNERRSKRLKVMTEY